MQPQIRLANRIRTHLLPRLLRLTVFISNATIRNRMHNMHALLAHLPRQSLRELADRCAASAVRSELRTTAQSTEGACEYDSLNNRISKQSPFQRGSVTYALLPPTLLQPTLPMIHKHPLQTLLRKRKCTPDIRLQAVLKLLSRLLQKRLLAAMLDAVNRHVEFQALEAFVRFYVCKSLFETAFGGVGREGFEHSGRVGLADFGDGGGDGVGAPGEEGDGEIAVRGGGEDACNA